MKPSEAVAAGFAGVGLAIILAGAVLSSAAPQMRDAIHGAGLVCMLIGAAVFLLGRQAQRFSRVTPRVHAPVGLQETAKNLAIAGATFLVGSLAVGLALSQVLSPQGLIYWILVGLGLLGVGAVLLGALGYAFAVLAGGNSGERRENLQ